MSKRWSSCVFAAVLFAGAGAAQAQAPVPELVNFNARLTDSSGVPVSGNHQVQLSLFDAATGGTSAWSETTTPTFSATGLVSIEMGSTTPLTAAIFSGARLYLQITVDGTPLTPRVSVASVPYAIRAGIASQAARLGTLQESDVQHRVTGSCPSGQMMTAVNADGTVTCDTPVTPPAGRTAGGANLIDWTPDVAKWTFLSGTNATIALNTTDVLEGASSFDVTVTTGATGSVYTYGPMIPVDSSRRYRGEIAAKLITGAGTFYAGYVAYDASGTALMGNGGTGATYGYFIAAGVTLNGNWQRYTGSIQGEGTNTDQFPVGTRFIRPLIITNYQNIGQTRIDSFSIIEMPTVRYVPRAFGNGPLDTTCDVNGACGPSPLATRTLTMNKSYNDTDLRLSYTDTMRAYGISPSATRSCRWHIYVDGQPCPSGDVGGVVYATPYDDKHDVRTIVGYCRSIAPGTHTVQVYVSNTAGYQARCYTGWPGDATWTLEAEEVR